MIIKKHNGGVILGKKKILSLAFLMLLLLSTALYGCSGGDETESGGEEGGETESGEEKVLIFGRGGDSVSLDPIAVTDGESFKVTKNIFDTLINFGEQDTEIEAGLASDWEAAEDGLTYTFQLQEGVTFHDGTDFNAEAVVANFERWSGGDSDQFPYYQSMFGGFGDAEEHVIESVEATGDYEVVITLKRPQAPFLKNLALLQPNNHRISRLLPYRCGSIPQIGKDPFRLGYRRMCRLLLQMQLVMRCRTGSSPSFSRMVLVDVSM